MAVPHKPRLILFLYFTNINLSRNARYNLYWSWFIGHVYFLLVFYKCIQINLSFLIVTTETNWIEYSFCFFTHTPMCVSTVYSVLPESCEKISQACYSGGIRTHNPYNSRAVSYQLGYRDCPVARGSLNPMFRQRVPQWYSRC